MQFKKHHIVEIIQNYIIIQINLSSPTFNAFLQVPKWCVATSGFDHNMLLSRSLTGITVSIGKQKYCCGHILKSNSQYGYSFVHWICRYLIIYFEISLSRLSLSNIFAFYKEKYKFLFHWKKCITLSLTWTNSCTIDRVKHNKDDRIIFKYPFKINVKILSHILPCVKSSCFTKGSTDHYDAIQAFWMDQIVDSSKLVMIVINWWSFMNDIILAKGDK